MIINQKKLNRQLQRQEKWMRANCSATLSACTGFGKTYEAILIIQRLHRKYPDAIVEVVVPGIDLKIQWDELAKFHKLQNVYVYVINTYIMHRHKPALLVLDEIHHYASPEFSKVFENAGCKPLIERERGDPFILGLTATIERLDGKHTFLEKYCPVIDEVTLEEARREGYVSNFIVYNWGLEFNEQDQKDYEKQDSIFKNSFAKFEHSFDLAMACAKGGLFESTLLVQDNKGNQIRLTKTANEWKKYWAERHDWDGTKEHFWSPFNISRYAQQFVASMRARKKLVHVASVKIDAVQELYKKFPVKTMIFAEDSTFANKVEEVFGKEICRAYHTYIETETIREEKFTKNGQVIYKDKKLGKEKTKERIKHLFKTQENPMILSTVKALNEGFDFEGVRLAVMASYNSSKRDDTQRTGRAVRIDIHDAAKKAIVVNLYIKNTQEEKWLKEKQRGKQGIIWVDSIDQISLEEQLLIKLAE